MIRLFVGVLVGLSALVTGALAADPVEVGIGYLRRAGTKPTLSLIEQPAENDGVAGARLAIEEPRGRDRKRLVTFVEIDRCATGLGPWRSLDGRP